MKIVLFYFLSISLYANNISYKLSYYEDKNQESINYIQLQEFKKIKKDYINKSFNFNDFWIKLEIKNLSNKKINKIWHMNNPTIDFIDFYENNRLKIQTGDHRDTNSREFKSIPFAFNLHLNPNEKKIYYLKINTHNAFSIKFTLLDKDTFLSMSEEEKMFLIFFLGFIISIILYNIFLWVILKEKIYLFYILFESSVLLLLLSLSGLGYYLIWQDNFVLNEFFLKKLDDLGIIFGVIFCKYFLNTQKWFPKINIVINIFLVALILVMITPWKYHYFAVKPVMIGSILLILFVAIYAVIKRIPSSKLYLSGWLFLLTASLATLMKNFGLLDSNFLTTWAIYIGAMFEALIFSIALAKKIDNLKQEKEEALLISKEKLNQEVNKKTILLTKALNEKELLLRETHHRVKNNLQIISAFISVASIKNGSLKSVFMSIQDRINAIFLLHNHLYKNENLEKIDLKAYLQNIVENLNLIYVVNKKIEYIYNIEKYYIEFDKVILLGLILNELVTNSLKYAYENISKPYLKISLKKIDNKNIFHIEDNGNKMPKDFDVKSSKSMGLKMVYRLATKQLGGSLEFSNHQNTSFKVIFKSRENHI